MTIMKTSLILAALAVPSLALAQLVPGAQVGTSEEAITAALEAQGYVIQETEVEDGMFEVEATLDGVPYEIEIDLTSGEVAEVEMDDDDDGDDEDDDGDSDDA